MLLWLPITVSYKARLWFWIPFTVSCTQRCGNCKYGCRHLDFEVVYKPNKINVLIVSTATYNYYRYTEVLVNNPFILSANCLYSSINCNSKLEWFLCPFTTSFSWCDHTCVGHFKDNLLDQCLSPSVRRANNWDVCWFKHTVYI